MGQQCSDLLKMDDEPTNSSYGGDYETSFTTCVSTVDNTTCDDHPHPVNSEPLHADTNEKLYSLKDGMNEYYETNRPLEPAVLADSSSDSSQRLSMVEPLPTSSSDGQIGIPKKLKTFSFGKRQKSKSKLMKETCTPKKKNSWNFKLNCAVNSKESNDEVLDPQPSCSTCVCTGYKQTDDKTCSSNNALDASVVALNNPHGVLPPVIDLLKFKPEDYPIDDDDEHARAERAREIREGIDPPPGFDNDSINSNGEQAESSINTSNVGIPGCPDLSIENLSSLFHSQLAMQFPHYSFLQNNVNVDSVAVIAQLSMIQQHLGINTVLSSNIHTQIDYVHCLVPDLYEITQCSFYWGKMDHYEAEHLLDNKADGTFLLRDSAQEEYLFSVSFRRYGRSLHARIEQWNHKFSFDSHDPCVFSSSSVCGLIEHYKDPSCCMFFEPMLTSKLNRKFVFPLQHLCRAVICKRITYDGINNLGLPKSIKSYLKEYHYKQRVRVRKLET